MDRDIAVALLDQLHAAQNEFYGGAVTPCCATFWHLQVVSMPRTSVGARFTKGVQPVPTPEIHHISWRPFSCSAMQTLAPGTALSHEWET